MRFFIRLPIWLFCLLSLGSLSVTYAAGQPDWDSVTLNAAGCLGNADPTSCVNGFRFRVDDEGNFSASPQGRSGQITNSDLRRLDSRIDAVKEEAHEPFECDTDLSVNTAVSVSMTFANRGNAIIYRVRPEISEVCWSGDRLAVDLLLSELLTLQGIYG